MPRLNERWEYAMGIAGIPGSVLTNLIPDAYGPCWFNNDEILFPQISDNKLYIMNMITNQRRLVSTDPSNEYKANGNNWAQWANIPGVGLRASNFHLPAAGLKDVGPDGAVGFSPDYQSGIGCDVIELDGARWTLDSGIVYDLQLLGNRTAIWVNENHNIRTFGIPNCIQVGKAYKPKAMLSFGKWWVSYWSTTKGLVLHPFDSTVGYVIVPLGTDAFGNVAGASDPYINVGWSTTEGEALGDYRSKLINVQSDARQDLGSTTPLPENGAIMIPAFERPMWMAPYFSFHTRYGDVSLNGYTGNAIIQLADDSDQGRFSSFGLPLIVDENCPSPNMNLTVAWYSSGGTISDLQTSVNDAKAREERPIIAYLDGRNWPDNNPFQSDRVWPAIQAYCMPTEAVADFRNTMIDLFERVKRYGLPLAIVTRFDDFNGSSSIDKTIQCMDVYNYLISNFPIVAHLPFADKRGNGIDKNPRLKEWARAFQYAIPFGRPNRYDYWQPSGLTNKQILENKFGQTRASVVIEPYLRTDILSKYDDEQPPTNGNEWPNLLPLLEAERKLWPDLMTANNCVAMINNVAKKAGNGWGLLSKSGGNHGLQPGTEIGCSVDWLVNPRLGKGTDCLIDGGDSTTNYKGKATPTWPSDGEPYDGHGFVVPV